MTTKFAFLICAATTLAFGAPTVSFQTHYISLGTNDTSLAIAADSGGNIFILSRTLDLQNHYGIRVTKTDPYGNTLASFDFGKDIWAAAITVEPQGSVLVAGSSYVADTFAANAILAGNVYIAKLDNALTTILGSTTLGNSATGATWVSGVTTDPSGHVYVAGSSVSADFPTTADAYERDPPHTIPGDPHHAPVYGFVAEFSQDLSTIMHATLYGSPVANCDLCYPPPNVPIAQTLIGAIAIDPSGMVVITGRSNAGVPVGGFVAKLSADLTSVQAQTAPPSLSTGSVTVDPQGNVLVFGVAERGMPFSPKALQPTLPGIVSGGFVAKFGNVPTLNLLWGTYFGSASGFAGGAVALDTQGNIWMTGFTDSATLPGSDSSSHSYTPFVAELSSDGSSLLNLVVTSFGGTAVTGLPGGRVAVLGPGDSFLLTGPPDQPSFLTVTNSADNLSSGTIAPSELISLYGTGIGPSSPITGQIVDGAFTDTLGGYQVVVNGSPTPLVFAGPDQFNTVVPKAVAGETAVIRVVGPQSSTTFPNVFIAPSRPQIFSVTNDSGFYRLILNDDGTQNSAANPANPGSTLTLWVSGAGPTNDQSIDGAIVQAPGSTPVLPLSLLLDQPADSFPLIITYAGNPPGVISGLTQINLNYASSSPASSVTFRVQAGKSVTAFAIVFLAAN